MTDTPSPRPALTTAAPRRLRALRAGCAFAPLVVVAACAQTPASEVTSASPPSATVTVTSTATTTVTSEVSTTATIPEPARQTGPARAPQQTVPAAATPAPAPEERAATGVSAGQSNAARSAQQYLAISGFSRSGLIEQLQYEGYSATDAAGAVDSLTVDWKEQAARSARQYLDISGFSRSGLIEQLQYEGYSADQAAYGATAAGL